jgi:hypothetical protein
VKSDVVGRFVLELKNSKIVELNVKLNDSLRCPMKQKGQQHSIQRQVYNLEFTSFFNLESSSVAYTLFHLFLYFLQKFQK